MSHAAALVALVIAGRGVAAGRGTAAVIAVAEAAAAAAVCGVFAIFANEDVATVEVGVGEHLDGTRGFVDGGHLDDATALGAAAGSAFGEDLGVDHVAGLAEVVFEVLPRDAPGEVVDVEAVGGDLDDFLLVVAAAGAAAVVAAVRVVAAGASAASAGWAVAHALVFCRVIDRADCQR